MLRGSSCRRSTGCAAPRAWPVSGRLRSLLGRPSGYHQGLHAAQHRYVGGSVQPVTPAGACGRDDAIAPLPGAQGCNRHADHLGHTLDRVHLTRIFRLDELTQTFDKGGARILAPLPRGDQAAARAADGDEAQITPSGRSSMPPGRSAPRAAAVLRSRRCVVTGGSSDWLSDCVAKIVHTQSGESGTEQVQARDAAD